MKIKQISEITEFLKKYADENKIEIVEVEFKQGRNPSLTVYIDKEGGVDLNTCEFFHRLIDEPLDELDPTFGEAYTLNVSSPGLDRPLKTKKDFESCLNEKVELKLYSPYKGEKHFEATLVAFDENTVSLDKGEGAFKLQLNQVVKISRAIEF